MKSAVIFLLIGLVGQFCLGQQAYNSCNNALEICPQINYTVSNVNANVTFCPSCEDDFNFCFAPNNSIWIFFTTNELGGDVTLNLFNMNFETAVGQSLELQATMIQAGIPCNSDSYIQVGNCEPIISTNFALNATGLLPLTDYFVVISGSDQGVGINTAAECTFDIYLSGPGANRTPPGLAIGVNSPICEGDAATVNAYVSNCPDNTEYKWFVNGILTAITDVNFFQSSELENGDVVSVETSCYLLCPVVLSQVAPPIEIVSVNIDAGSDVSILEGGSTQLNGQTTAPISYWTPTFNITDTSILNPVVSPTETTVYTLHAEDSGCVFTDYVTVFVDNELFFPNTFSPNEDEENDTWEIKGIEKYPNNQLLIYNRWGQIVHQASGYNKQKAWDGTALKGGKLNDSVYYYEMKLLDVDKRTFKGSITIVR